MQRFRIADGKVKDRIMENLNVLYNEPKIYKKLVL
jgi:hypothetical protein